MPLILYLRYSDFIAALNSFRLIEHSNDRTSIGLIINRDRLAKKSHFRLSLKVGRRGMAMFIAFVVLFFAYWSFKIVEGEENIVQGVLALCSFWGFLGLFLSGLMYIGQKMGGSSLHGEELLYNMTVVSVALFAVPAIRFVVGLVRDGIEEKNRPNIDQVAEDEGFMPKGYSAIPEKRQKFRVLKF